ncbi:hypothetical protein GALL_467360 [mine drainage metagenome]|uniref:Uncharacterized protein n=1 Tax=mine drainage metagenome TaxID=410659 RepID=A0A1J5PVR2_9ZZZZ
MAAVKLCRQGGIAPQQRRAAVQVPLGLENLLTLKAAKLADGPIHRANQAGRSQRPHTRGQFTGEKIIKSGVTGDVRVGCLKHVDPVALHKPGNQAGRQGTEPSPGQVPCQQGEPLLGQQVLWQDGETVRHGKQGFYAVQFVNPVPQ